ncbi:hypothetical protein, partial [Enterococcus casseliflavus]|uniref:hypothetical protein n=1 Tax=Enterococcus casseliflavus TaxID=37734 RepID=UPI001C8F308F
GALAGTGAPFYFTQKTARNERFLVISCGFLLWTYVTVPFVLNLKIENHIILIYFCLSGTINRQYQEHPILTKKRTIIVLFLIRSL